MYSITVIMCNYVSYTALRDRLVSLLRHQNFPNVSIYFLIVNSYVNFNGHVYRQVIGFPMGTSAALHVAYIY